MLHAVRHYGVPAHTKNLWKIKEQVPDNPRDWQIQLDYRITTKLWINDLPPISQAKLWNNDLQIKNNKPDYFKFHSKVHFIECYEHIKDENNEEPSNTY